MISFVINLQYFSFKKNLIEEFHLWDFLGDLYEKMELINPFTNFVLGRNVSSIKK